MLCGDPGIEHACESSDSQKVSLEIFVRQGVADFLFLGNSVSETLMIRESRSAAILFARRTWVWTASRGLLKNSLFRAKAFSSVFF
jgi:hypothetical protein